MNGIWTSEAPSTRMTRRTLHSWPYWVLSRYFVLMPAGLMAKMGYQEARANGISALGPYVFPALLVVFIALVIRLSTPRVYATNAGMEVRHGFFKCRLIPWSRVRAVSELPWIRYSTPWQPKMWQIDFEHAPTVSFIGKRKVPKIVATFQNEAPAGHSSSGRAHPAS
ncbi:MAG TPA: hypothetical protein VHW01_18625 [Polyangiaceae bacterium]|jgi:hypothetical protein|nr:hypothetical protein [Polyangiaceae bacterium]